MEGKTDERGREEPSSPSSPSSPTSEKNKGRILGPKKNVSVQNKRANWRGAHLSLSYGMSSCHCLLFPLSHATADQKAALDSFFSLRLERDRRRRKREEGNSPIRSPQTGGEGGASANG